MVENQSPVEAFSSLCSISAQHLTMKSLVLSGSKGECLKIKYTLVNAKGGASVQKESFLSEGRVKQDKLSTEALGTEIAEAIGGFSRADLADSGGSASLMRSKKGKVTLVRHGKIGEGEAETRSEQHEKKYILNASEDFLVFLDISDKSGRVHDKKQGKFRQINRFLEMVRDIQKYLPKNGEIRVSDLCCGKSYLSFAVYYYFSVIEKREIVMDCVDLKESVMDYCAAVAKELHYDGMRFSTGDITAYSPEKKPHLVISLHACDTATDIVLDAGIRCGADVILSTPCCHRQLSRELDCGELAFVSRHATLRHKMCDALTDSLRILRLEACGYECDAPELVDPEDTPKNILIRAHKRYGLYYKKANNAKADEYRAAYKYLTGKEAPPLPVIGANNE